MNTQTPNYPGAFFSFMRVFSVALASALLPTLQQGGELTVKAVGTAFGASFLLTVINFFRTGETRFGPPPNPGAEPPGGDDIGTAADAPLPFQDETPTTVVVKKRKRSKPVI